MFLRKGVLKIWSKLAGEHSCRSVISIKLPATQACNFIKKEALAQVFSCEFCKISQNTFSYRTPPVAASDEYLEPCRFLVELWVLLDYDDDDDDDDDDDELFFSQWLTNERCKPLFPAENIVRDSHNRKSSTSCEQDLNLSRA